MLHVYTDKRFIPSNLKYIDDPEPLAHSLKITKTEQVCEIIRVVENGEYKDETTFVDRFGRCLFNSCLSSGASALIVASILGPDYVVNANDLGLNSANRIISCLDNCCIYYEQSPTMYGHDDTVYACKDDICKGGSELTIAMSGVDMSYFKSDAE